MSPTRLLTLHASTRPSQAEFVALLDGIYEHSPWIAERRRGAAARSPAWRS